MTGSKSREWRKKNGPGSITSWGFFMGWYGKERLPRRPPSEQRTRQRGAEETLSASPRCVRCYEPRTEEYRLSAACRDLRSAPFTVRLGTRSVGYAFRFGQNIVQLKRKGKHFFANHQKKPPSRGASCRASRRGPVRCRRTQWPIPASEAPTR